MGVHGMYLLGGTDKSGSGPAPAFTVRDSANMIFKFTTQRPVLCDSATLRFTDKSTRVSFAVEF